MKYTSLLIFFLFLSMSCAKQLSKPFDVSTMVRPYSECIGDAAKAQIWEISNELTIISRDNDQLIWKEINGADYLLVSSWKTDTTYYVNDSETGFYNTQSYPIWVTVAPELQAVCQNNKFGRREGVDLRLKQLLGLPPNVEKNYFVEFWVQPKDLFRPCPDNEITDSSCQIGFPVGTEEDHINWINNLRLSSYYQVDWDQNYPWTQLGYTYDWNPRNKTHIGMSEFVIGPDVNIIVHQVHTTAAYCRIEE
ncbi:MAG: hypothetical protein AAFY91_07615 [Bacteroidota bacterium]